MSGIVQAEWWLVLACAPRVPVAPAGILLLNRQSNELLVKLKADLNSGDKDIDLIWTEVAGDLQRRVSEVGAEEVMGEIEDTWSNVFRISGPQSIEAKSLVGAVESLYHLYVESSAGNTHRIA